MNQNMSNDRGHDYGGGQSTHNGPFRQQWRLMEARQICPVSFWEVLG